jgi:hypothetical protein
LILFYKAKELQQQNGTFKDKQQNLKWKKKIKWRGDLVLLMFNAVLWHQSSKHLFSTVIRRRQMKMIFNVLV